MLLCSQVSVLEEAKIMIPDTRQRLEGALQDLTSYVVGANQCIVITNVATCPMH